MTKSVDKDDELDYSGVYPEYNDIDDVNPHAKGSTTMNVSIGMVSPHDKKGGIIKTILKNAVKRGDKKIDVITTDGMKEGMLLVLTKDDKSDRCRVKGFGSVLLDRVLLNNYPAGTEVCM